MFTLWSQVAWAVWPSTSIPFYDDDTCSVYIADLDGDGVADLLVDLNRSVGEPSGRLVWLRGPTFTESVELATLAAGEHRVSIVDIDGDNRQDILFADNDLSWVKNLGAGAFAPEAWLVPSLGATSLAAGDLDGDGNIDVVLTDASGVSWLAGDGMGGFGPATFISSDTSARPDLVDIDSDSDLDVVLASLFSLELATNDQGSLSAPVELSPISYRAYALVDLDRDFDLDLLASTGTFPRPAVWYENTGGVMGPAVDLLDVQSTLLLGAADLDSDADLDPLIIAHDVGHQVLALENQGGGSFGAPFVLGDFAEGAQNIAIGDLDGDADRDVVLAAKGLFWDDGWAQLYLFTNDTVVDTDRDGLSDEAEIELGTDPETPDSDGGGVSDGEELEDYHDPLDPTDDALPLGDQSPESNDTATHGTATNGTATNGTATHGTGTNMPGTGETSEETAKDKPELIQATGVCGCSSVRGGPSPWLGLALIVLRRRQTNRTQSTALPQPKQPW